LGRASCNRVRSDTPERGETMTVDGACDKVIRSLLTPGDERLHSDRRAPSRKDAEEAMLSLI
jgi:hypothetical protein